MSIESGKPTEPFIRFEKRPNIKKAIREIQAIEPKVIFDTHLGWHVTNDDGLSLCSQIINSDLFIPEGIQWSKEKEKQFNDVSRGRIPIESVSDDPFYRGLLWGLELTDTPVKFIDYPEGHPNGATLINSFSNPKELIAHQDKREEYMIEQLPKTLNEFIDENPTLINEKRKKGKPLEVFLFLGALHTRISHVLKEVNPQSTRSFSEKPFIYPADLNNHRQFLFGKNVELLDPELNSG